MGGSVPTSAPLPRLLEVMVAGYPVLLVRNRKEFRALGSKCPHYGAPLSKGNSSSGQGDENPTLERLVLTAQLRGFSCRGFERGEAALPLARGLL